MHAVKNNLVYNSWSVCLPLIYIIYISISPLYLLTEVYWAFSTTGNQAMWKTRQGTVTDSSNASHGHDEVSH